MKTMQNWIDEAVSFAYEWKQATGKAPTKNDVLRECKEIASGDSDIKQTMIDECGSVEQYAEELYSYI